MESRLTYLTKPSLLLHICCGTCSTHVIESLLPNYDIVGFFFNPNIHPAAEFLKRLKDTCRVCRHYDIPLWVPFYFPNKWFSVIQGMEDEPEGGRRCEACFLLRLEETAKHAQSASIPWMATTLSVSPHKSSKKINEIGHSFVNKYAITFLDGDFKKKNGFLRSLAKSKELGLYRQGYCGCYYSAK